MHNAAFLVGCKPRFERKYMRRRDFITLAGGAAIAGPLAARAQQPAMPVIGYLYGGSAETSAYVMGPFRKGLSEAGFVEGRNVAIEYRFAQGEYDRLPELAADLVRRQVAVIVTPASIPAALAAKAATKTIPVVFAFSRDPVELGLVASLSRPGGNVTGSASLNAELLAKQLGFLHELLPHATRIAVLINPNNPAALAVTRDVQEAAAGIGGPIDVVHAGTAREIDVAFAKLVQMRADALLVSSDALFGNRRVDAP
jgi:ABC-type uncharacterized transport system substrate-binding protein